MELGLHRSRGWTRRRPDWAAAVGAGVVGGAVLMVLDLLWSALVTGDSPWRTSRLIAAIVMGPDTLQADDFAFGIVAVALVTHYVLGIVFALVLAWIVAALHWEASLGMQEVIGAVFGTVLYVVDFHVMTLVFPWLAELRGWPTYLAHLVFGVTLVVVYPLLARRRASA